MRFEVERSAFSDAVTTVAKAIPNRPVMPVLGGIRLSAGASGLTLDAYDYETSIHARVNADVSVEGTAVVSGKLLADIAKALPRKPVRVSLDDSTLRVDCGTARFSLPLMPADEYPALPTAPDAAGQIPAELFSKVIGQVSVAAGKDDSLPMLTGVRVEAEGGRALFAATDRFRLAVRELDWDGPDAQMLIPAKTLVDVTRSLPAGTNQVGLGLADGLLGVGLGDVSMTARLMDMEFPKFRQLLPSEHVSVAVVDAGELADAVKRAGLVAERGAQVRLSCAEGGVTVVAGADGGGSSEEIVPCAFAGDRLVIAFNPQYLLDGLAAVGDGQVVFGFTHPNRPATLRKLVGDVPSGDGPFACGAAEFVYLLMPVRIASV